MFFWQQKADLTGFRKKLNGHRKKISPGYVQSWLRRLSSLVFIISAFASALLLSSSRTVFLILLHIRICMGTIMLIVVINTTIPIRRGILILSFMGQLLLHAQEKAEGFYSIGKFPCNIQFVNNSSYFVIQ